MDGERENERTEFSKENLTWCLDLGFMFSTCSKIRSSTTSLHDDDDVRTKTKQTVCTYLKDTDTISARNAPYFCYFCFGSTSENVLVIVVVLVLVVVVSIDRRFRPSSRLSQISEFAHHTIRHPNFQSQKQNKNQQSTMKLLIATLLAGSAAAFTTNTNTPVVQTASTQLAGTAGKAAYGNELGVQMPLGFWDPLGLLDDADQEYFDRLRWVELKHGRVAM